MDKILTVTWKELYSTFTDRPRLLYMLATPLAISLILGLAFGGGSGDLTIQDIPVAIVNLDVGNDEVNYGSVISSLLLSESAQSDIEQTCELSNGSQVDAPSLENMIDGRRYTDPALARQDVDDGTLAVAIVIPSDFTEKLAPAGMEQFFQTELKIISVEVYGSGANPVSVTVVQSITEAIVQSVQTGNITIRSTLQSLIQNPSNIQLLLSADESQFAGFACGFTSDLATLGLDRLPLDDVQARSPFEQVLIGLGSAQAVFFSLGTAMGSVQSIYEDRKTWILQRLLSTPTPRASILAGKLLGTLAIAILQILILMISLSLIASITNGNLTFLWGTNWLALAVLILSISFAVSGVAVFVVGLAPSPEQANMLGSLVTLGLALLGGAFGFQLGEVAKVSIIYWGVNGFDMLSAGQASIDLNLLVLLSQGIILFTVGTWLFNRRITV